MQRARAEDGSAQSLLDFITQMILEHGYLVVLAGSAGDNLGIPATGDVVMFAGGWLSNAGHTVLPFVMLVGALGALLADNASYWVGRAGGRALISRLLKHRLLSRLVSASRMDQAEGYFQTHGGKTVLIGRFTPGMRGPTPLFAGVSRMSYPRFAAFNASAIAVWATAYALVGYAFGEYWNELLLAARSFGFIILSLTVVAFGAYLYRRRRASEARTNHGFAAGKGTKKGDSMERTLPVRELLILTVILTALVVAVYVSFAP